MEPLHAAALDLGAEVQDAQRADLVGLDQCDDGPGVSGAKVTPITPRPASTSMIRIGWLSLVNGEPLKLLRSPNKA